VAGGTVGLWSAARAAPVGSLVACAGVGRRCAPAPSIGRGDSDRLQRRAPIYERNDTAETIVADEAGRQQRLITDLIGQTSRERARRFRADSEQSRRTAASLRVEAALLRATVERSAAEVARSQSLLRAARALGQQHERLWESIERETATRPARRKKIREAHFAVLRLVIDGMLWPTSYATLDVYHHGPDYDDLNAAQWEVHFQPCTRPGALIRNETYVVEADIRDGRCLTGKAFLEHAGAILALLDAGEPLDGLRAGDLD
jgi:hypothetical protein